MNDTAFSLMAYGVYEGLVGLSLIFFSPLVLKLVKLSDMNHPWVKVVGILAILVAYYHYLIGYYQIEILYEFTIYGRLFFATSMIGLILTQSVPFRVWPFAVASYLGCLWTYVCLLS